MSLPETIPDLDSKYAEALKAVIEAKQQIRALKLVGSQEKIDTDPLLTIVKTALDSLTKALGETNAPNPNQDGPDLVAARLRKKIGTLQRCLTELDPAQTEKAE